MSKSIAPSPHEELGAIVLALRAQCGMTQVELASRLGKPQSFVSNIERGERRIDVVEFCAVVQVLGGDPKEVLGRFMARLPSRSRK